MATVSYVSATGNNDIDGLLSGYKWSGTLTYSFPDSASDYPSGYGYGEPTAAGFAQVSAAQQTAIHRIMGLIGEYTNLTIQYAGTDTADVRIAQSSEANPTAYAYYPWSGTGGDIWFGTSYNYRNPKLGDYYYLTHIHETGHALGLKHAHEIEGVANVAVPAGHDALEYTVMSYRSYVGGPTSGGYTNETYGYPTTFMMNDIRALQEMYGADYTTNSGDTVYSWSATTGEFFINDAGQGQPGGVGASASANVVFMTVWDGGGEDTYDFSNYTSALTVNLNPGAYSVTSATQLANLNYYGSGGAQYAHGNVYNAYLYNNDGRSYIENVIGGSGGDTLIGNATGNEIDGGAGNDTMTGGAGADVFVFGSGYGLDLITDFSLTFDQIDFTGLALYDDFASAMAMGNQVGANTVFSFSVSLSLTLQNVSFAGLSEDNFIFGESGPSEPNEAPTAIELDNLAINENLLGGIVGTISVTDPDDTAFTFEVSDERFEVTGTPGSYVLKLVAGEWLDYENEPEVTVTVTATDSGDLSFSEDFTITVNDVNGVTIVGSWRADVINESRTAPGQALPTNDDDIIYGMGGNDVINGLGGSDIIDGGAGNDVIYGGYGNDTLIGGAGADKLYGGEDDNVFVISGADAVSDLIYGGAGTDTIEVSGSASVTLSRFSSASTSIEVWDGNDQAVLGTTRADIIDFSAFESFSGVSYVDTGAGSDLIIGCYGDEDLRGGTGNDVIYAGDGSDRIVGGAGADGLYGGAGDDVFAFGGIEASTDVIRGEAGNDTIEITGSASVTLSRFDAGVSSIENWVGNGNGVIGTNGADLIDFSDLTSVSGMAFVDGGKGNDWLTGSLATDILRGGIGNDVITGGLGDDILSGGAGNDRFVFAPGFGNDIITDFSAGWRVGDVIAMDADIFADLNALLAASAQVGSSVVITASETETLTLQNTLLSNLHANDFAFV